MVLLYLPKDVFQFLHVNGVPIDSMRGLQQASEIEQLQKSLEPGRLYVTDRGYFSFDLMAAILKHGSSFVGRVRNNLVYEVLDERPLTAADRKRGVVSDRIVRAGFDADNNPVTQPLRLLEIHVTESSPSRRARVDSKSKAYRTRETDHVILLLTDELDLEVETIGLLYRFRWQIELFFRFPGPGERARDAGPPGAFGRI